MKIIAIVLVTAAAPAALAQAPLSTENTKRACSDGIDNDGDGRVDCADQDCWDLVMCANVTPGAGNPTPRKAGYTKLVLGAVLLPLGIVFGAVSAAPWVLMKSSDGDTENALIGTAAAMDVLALAGLASGTALLAMGVGEVAGSHDRRVVVPGLSVGRQSASLSLSISF